MGLFTGTQLVSGGFQFVIVNCFSIMISWAACFFVYAGTHLGFKILKIAKERGIGNTNRRNS